MLTLTGGKVTTLWDIDNQSNVRGDRFRDPLSYKLHQR